MCAKISFWGGAYFEEWEYKACGVAGGHVVQVFNGDGDQWCDSPSGSFYDATIEQWDPTPHSSFTGNYWNSHC
jgi:hypothetical protein